MKSYTVVVCMVLSIIVLALIILEIVHLAKGFHKVNEESERERFSPPQVLVVKQEAGEVRFAYATKAAEGYEKKPTLTVNESEPEPPYQPQPAAPAPAPAPSMQHIQAEPFFIPMPLYVNEQPTASERREEVIHQLPPVQEPPKPAPAPAPAPEKEEPKEDEEVVVEVIVDDGF